MRGRLPRMSPELPSSNLFRRLVAARWALLLAWMGVIFAFSALPGSAIPGRFSVGGHFIEYAVLGVLMAFALHPTRGDARGALLALVLCSLYAVSDEAHQAFVPGRTPDVADWAVDTIGAAVGIAAAVAVLARRLARRGAG